MRGFGGGRWVSGQVELSESSLTGPGAWALEGPKMANFMGVSVGLAVWIALRAFRAPDRVRGGFRGAPGSLQGVILDAFWTSLEASGDVFGAFREPRG